MSDKKFAGMAKSFENINLLTGNGSTNLSVTNRNPATTPSEFSFKVKNKNLNPGLLFYVFIMI